MPCTSESDCRECISICVLPSALVADAHTKPNDCDFIHAPLGDKGCSYKAHVKVYNADGVLVAGENAPKYGSDTKTAKPIISYDGGKNWDWYIGGRDIPGQKKRAKG